MTGKTLTLEELLEASSDLLTDISKGLGDLTIRIVRNTDRLYGSGKQYAGSWMNYLLSGLPGCCGVVVSHGSWLDEPHRGNGLGDFFHKERLWLARKLGYSVMMATTISSNTAEIHILEKNGWDKVYEFKNTRTNNTVQIWVKDLHD